MLWKRVHMPLDYIRFHFPPLQAANETLRSEHTTLMRQAQRRQEEIEIANLDLTRTIMEKEREVWRHIQHRKR
jgi:hypothetical protein